MTNLWDFFSSFDKLMKEKLVKAFFWLALTIIVILFLEVIFDVLRLRPINALLDFVLYFVSFLTFIVGLRLACELAIALFRINDNLSPDGGKSESANIDPLEEARRAAEIAARRAREATKNTFEKTSEATKQTFDKASDATKSTFDKSPFGHHDEPSHTPGANPARTPNVTSTRSTKSVSSKSYKTAAVSKTKTKSAPTVKSSITAKKSAPKKKAVTKKATTPRRPAKTASGAVKYNKDGTIKRKPGPKPGSSSKYTKDGRLKKKPGPKPK